MPHHEPKLPGLALRLFAGGALGSPVRPDSNEFQVLSGRRRRNAGLPVKRRHVIGPLDQAARRFHQPCRPMRQTRIMLPPPIDVMPRRPADAVECENFFIGRGAQPCAVRAANRVTGRDSTGVPDGRIGSGTGM